MRRCKGQSSKSAIHVAAVTAAAAVLRCAAKNNDPSVAVQLDERPPANLHDDPQLLYSEMGRIRKRTDYSNIQLYERRRNLGLLSDSQNHADYMYVSTETESDVQALVGSQSRHRIRRHKGDDPDGLLAKFLVAGPVNAATETDISHVAQGHNSESSTIYSSALFPRDGHQQLTLVGNVITVQTTQADISTDYIVKENNQVYNTNSGQPVAVQNVLIFWNPSTNGFVDSSGNNIPVDISVEYVREGGNYFSEDSAQGRYEIRNGQLYYTRTDGAVINTGFTIEAGTNELIYTCTDAAASVDRIGVAYRESDGQFILIDSSKKVVQFAITPETITAVKDKVTKGQVVVETCAGNIVIEEKFDAAGGLAGGDGDDDCKNNGKGYLGKGKRRGGKGKGRYRRHRSRGKGRGRSYSKSKKKQSKSSKGSRRLVEMDFGEEADKIVRNLKSSKGSSHSKSSKASSSGKGKGRFYSGKGDGKGYSTSRSEKKKKDRCDSL